MLSIAHGATGALIASKIPNPVISIPLILVSHYLEDQVPHWDVGQGLSSWKKSRKTAFFQELFFDLPLSALLVFLIFQVGHPFDYRIWMGWFFSLVPDFLEFPNVFLDLKFTILKRLSKLHRLVHHSTPDKFWGLLSQVLVILLVILLK